MELHVPADPGETFFVRFGEWFVLLLWILLAAWLLTAAEHRRRIRLYFHNLLTEKKDLLS